ncbi:MAG: alpha/beta fold hydrolase [Thermoleophilaceae bacterium]
MTVEAAGVELAVDDRGEGAPAVVLVHGIASDRSVWTELAVEARRIAYDRRAYGDSGAPEPYGGTTVGEQADDLAQLIRAMDAAPAVLCGHDFGAEICLDVLVRFPELVRGAVLIEPPMLWLSAEGSEALSKLRAEIEQGDAVEAYLGEDASLLGPERVEAAHRALRGFAADLGAIASLSVGRRELRAVEQRAIVIAGADPLYGEVASKLAGLLPRGELLRLDTGHFPQIEQPDAVAAAITRIASA